MLAYYKTRCQCRLPNIILGPLVFSGYNLMCSLSSGYQTNIFHAIVLFAVSGKFHYRTISLGLISLIMLVAEYKL